MKKILLGTTILLLGVGSVIGCGFLPKKTYYPVGQLQSEVSRFFYKPHGLYKEYYENGTIKKELTYYKGIINGPFKEYHENGTIVSGALNNGEKDGLITITKGANKTEFLFKNGKFSGEWPVVETRVQINDDSSFSHTIKSPENIEIKGHFICSADEAIETHIAYKEKKDNILPLKCLNIEKMSLKEKASDKNRAAELVYEGSFVYPTFKSKSIISFTFPDELVDFMHKLNQKQLNHTVMDDEILSHCVGKKILITIHEDNQNLDIDAINVAGKPILQTSFDVVDVANIVRGMARHDEKVFFDALKAVTLKKFEFKTVSGFTDLSIEGKVGLTGVEDGTSISWYVTKDKKVLEIIKDKDVVHVTINYPYSGGKWISFDVNPNNHNMDKLIDLIGKMDRMDFFSFMTLLSRAEDYIPKHFVINNLKLMDKDGNTLLKSDVLKLPTEDFNLNDLMGDITVLDNQKTITYHFDPDKSGVQKTTDAGKEIILIDQFENELHEIMLKHKKYFDTVLSDEMEKLIKLDKKELSTIILSGYYGYKVALSRYTANQILDMANKYALVNYAAYQTHALQDKPFNPMTLTEIGLDIPEELGEKGIFVKSVDDVTPSGVTLSIQTRDVDVCHQVAYLTDGECDTTTNTIHDIYFGQD